MLEFNKQCVRLVPWLRGLERKSLVRRLLANNGRWLCPSK